MTERSRSLQIYMKPGIREDDLMLRVWDACRRNDRPQDVFRSMLRAGLLKMLETGEMPDSIIEECGLDVLLERHHKRNNKQAAGSLPHYPGGYPHPQYIQPVPVHVMPQQGNAWPGHETQSRRSASPGPERVPDRINEHGRDGGGRAKEPAPAEPDRSPPKEDGGTTSPSSPSGRRNIGNLM